MGLSCGGSCLKCLVFFFNALVFVGGGILSGFGIYLVIESAKATSTQTMGVSAFVLAVGLLIFLLGFLGCVGACTENVCMLKTFAVIIAILVILEIIAAILLFIKEIAAMGIQYQIKEILSGSNVVTEETKKALDELQKHLNCCGGEGPADWKNQIPASCCASGSANCANPYPQGCAEALYNAVKDKTLVMGIVIVVLAVLELGAIIAACVLAHKINAK
ncbi:Leukocyte surface antigen cd53 [Sparganum proliferum]